MDVLHQRCCGLDVHKSSISACILLHVCKRPAVAVWTGVSLEVMLAMWTEAIVSTWSDDRHIHSTRRT